MEWHSNQRWLSSDITDVSLTAQPRRALVLLGEGGAGSCSEAPGLWVPQLPAVGSSSLLPAEREEAGWGKGGTLPVGCSQRQWWNQFERRGFRTKTCDCSYSGLLWATWDSWQWQMLILSIHYIVLNVVSEKAKGTGLKIYKPQSRMW